MSEPLVVVNGLSKAFKDFHAVKGIDFEVRRGECFGLLGANGAGKSTTIKMMTTLLKPTSGMIRIGGFLAGKQPTRIREMIGYVPQAISVDGMLTGYENLLFMAKLYGLSRKERSERISQILSAMELEEAAQRLAKTYSGGMIRRLEIGQAIIHRPQVLFLDEPTVGLDPVARKSVWQHIERLRKELDMTVILTTHYMDEAESMCSNIAIMSQGRIAAMGTVERLREQTGNPAASMDDIFAYYSGGMMDHLQLGGMRDVSKSRNTAQRLG